MPKLRALVYLQSDGLPEGLSTAYPCVPLETISAGALAARHLAAEDALLLAAADEDLLAAAGLGLAAAAYVRVGRTRPTANTPMLIEGFDEVDDTFLERVFLRCHGLPWTILQTPRCIVRELSLSDLPALFALYDKKGVTDFLEPLFCREDEEAYQRAYIRNMYGFFGYGMWLVFARDGQTLIGRAGLELREYPQGTELELGYLIAPEWQRQGLATEVCAAILDYARGLGFSRVNALTAPENTASTALLQKLGFSWLEDTRVTGSLMRRFVYEL